VINAFLKKALPAGKGRKGGNRMISVDENLFFREATLRLCSSLDIETALKRCHEYIRVFIPVNPIILDILDFEENTLKFVAMVGPDLPFENCEEHILSLDKEKAPERVAFWQTGEVIRIMNLPDPKKISPGLMEDLKLKGNISLMHMVLELEGNKIGNLRISGGRFESIYP
jgi:hypothetical protein